MTHHDSETCAWTTQRLDDFVDAELGPDEQRRVEAHLEECPRCRADEASLRALLDEVAALPRSITPDRDLWPEIADRLDPCPLCGGGKLMPQGGDEMRIKDLEVA